MIAGKMEPIFLLDLASRKTAWLAARQAVVAQNIANANTPGYQTKDVGAFADVLAKTRLDMATTDTAHLSTGPLAASGGMSDIGRADDFEVTESGNTVGLESEMAKAGEVNRDYALTTNIVKSFHSMLLAALKA